MRFTTSNVFIISAVALLSLIPAANAIEIGFINPKPAQTYSVGESVTVDWFVLDPDNETLGQSGDFYMKNFDGFSVLLAKDVAILSSSFPLTIPSAPPTAESDYGLLGSSYYVSFETYNFGVFNSELFYID
ncbi:hypothetical protein BJV77DRAFT_1069213 [Russula vinacea]|nr:hypothetical protein BJV77DRAFT_1069213 [Russula vinacea]